jgi:hypothetical protein
VTGANVGEAARAVVRARERGYPVLVTHDRTVDPEAIRFARQLGAHLITPVDPAASPEYLQRQLRRDAQRRGYADIVIRDPERVVNDDPVAPSPDTASDVEPAQSRERDAGPVVVAAIPAYNEADSIGDVISGTRPHVDEVIVVDDGSDDDTAAVARAVGATVVEHETNRGYGSAIKTAFREARRHDTDWLVTIDADGQHDPAAIPRLVETGDSDGADAVIGSRYVDDGGSNAPLYRRVGLRVVNVATNLSLGTLDSDRWISDTQSGLRAYARGAIATLAEDDSIGERMNASIDILYHLRRHGYRLSEVGIRVDYDVDGASSRNPVVHGLTLLNTAVRTVEQERPLTVLGVPGFLGALLGVGVGYRGLEVYVATGTFPVGLALVATFLALCGVLTCFIGLILHALNVQFAGRPLSDAHDAAGGQL